MKFHRSSRILLSKIISFKDCSSKGCSTVCQLQVSVVGSFQYSPKLGLLILFFIYKTILPLCSQTLMKSSQLSPIFLRFNVTSIIIKCLSAYVANKLWGLLSSMPNTAFVKDAANGRSMSWSGSCQGYTGLQLPNLPGVDVLYFLLQFLLVCIYFDFDYVD